MPYTHILLYMDILIALLMLWTKHVCERPNRNSKQLSSAHYRHLYRACQGTPGAHASFDMDILVALLTLGTKHE